MHDPMDELNRLRLEQALMDEMRRYQDERILNAVRLRAMMTASRQYDESLEPKPWNLEPWTQFWFKVGAALRRAIKGR